MSDEIPFPKRTRHYTPEEESLSVVGFKVIRKRYQQVRQIFAELGQSDTLLLRALKEGHGIEFDSLRQDPFLYFTVSQEQTEGLAKVGVINPTFLQLLGSSEVIATTEAAAIERYRKMKEE